MIIAVIFEFCKWGVAGNLPAEGVGGNEVPTRGRLSPKKIIFTQCAKNTKLIWNSHPEGD